MDLLESKKKYPAFYTVLATVMDDVSIDRDKAQNKWGIGAVAVAEVKNNAAVNENEVAAFFEDLMYHLGVAGAGASQDFQTAVAQGVGKTSTPTKVYNQGGPVTPTPPGGTDSRGVGANYKKKSQVLTGTVQSVNAIPKAPQYGPGHRHVMVVMPDGEEYGVEGTIPRDHIGKVEPGDKVTLRAQVWSFTDKRGWFKYPKEMKVVVKA